jgi:hypothetical protein
MSNSRSCGLSFFFPSLTASTLFVLAPSVQGMQLFLYYLILAAVLWAIVVAVKVTDLGRLEKGLTQPS